ncbi:MAG TPA: choice-of-anchor D domain-containing protein, partial [Polyangiaceae bacterium]|nr:choice-of-anchor D domain-containing protein [Polyangiaceae bacterium]
MLTEFRPRTSGDAKSAQLSVAMSGGAPQLVELLGAGIDPGSLAVAPAEGNGVDFGAVALGEERTQVFQVNNGSAQTSGPLALSASGDFTLVPASQPGDCENGQTSLDNGASCNLTVKLAPTRRAAQYGSISIRSPLAKGASLRFSGTGMAPPRLAVAEDEINFGRVLTGGTYQNSVTVLNQGDQELPPLVATLQEPSGAAAADFSLENGCTSPLPFQGSCQVNVRFTPTTPGFPVAVLRVEGVAGGAGSTLLYGEVSQAGTLVLAVTEGQSAEFGDVGILTSKTVAFTLTNPSTIPSGRLSITASSPLFTIDPGTCNPAGSPGLANGESCTFSVTYRPITPEAADATLSIQSPGAGGAALSLSGQGRSPANLVAVGNRDFATANLGQAEATDPRNDFTWSLQNDGDLATGTLQVTNSNPTDFALAADACNGQSLPGHGSCEISVRFRPTATEARSGDLVVLDPASSQSVTLKMTGTGVQIAQPGESCVNATCATGECTGGVCCNVSCVGGCQECNAEGVCVNFSGRERCGDGSGVCFGVDRCLLPEGESCSADAQCGSNNCELRLGGSGATARVCCLESCAGGDQCNPDGSGCQAPTLAEGAVCGGAGQLACGNGLACKACLAGGRRCTPPDECCGGCDGDQVCEDGSCECPGGTVDCQDGRCILDRAGACCDADGCIGSGEKVACNANSDLCVCPANEPRECPGNVCIPTSQCCNCGGPCQTCNATTGTCGQVANGQQGQCAGGQVCTNGQCARPANVGLGQACNAQANNCSAGSCVAGTCQCGAGTTACGGRCVNTTTDAANCGRCNNSCGTVACVGGSCSCPSGQTFVPGAGCRLPDGASCTVGGVACASGPCNAWLSDCDRDGFGEADPSPIRRCGAEPPPGTPICVGGRFALSTLGSDCCDTDANAFPGQTARFAAPMPEACQSGGRTHDYNCNGREEGAPVRICETRTTAAACAAVRGAGTNFQSPGAIVVRTNFLPETAVEGAILCGITSSPGGCDFFTAANPGPNGEVGCVVGAFGLL